RTVVPTTSLPGGTSSTGTRSTSAFADGRFVDGGSVDGGLATADFLIVDCGLRLRIVDLGQTLRVRPSIRMQSAISIGNLNRQSAIAKSAIIIQHSALLLWPA